MNSAADALTGYGAESRRLFLAGSAARIGIGLASALAAPALAATPATAKPGMLTTEEAQALVFHHGACPMACARPIRRSNPDLLAFVMS